ncbi:LysM peptidoglycan-binding domain-containing protein [Phytohabitans houttuyneae]|uniref:LysM domain-containing protein n=1 Tax=Phytohabitans houttuyneae TaxID=1076126 RepID=A0A6V8K6R0_9ACTN|nr:LysM peptidoglycan-binding domain-containing protein [Phytohabitans houttuyneae]GFJ77799.1 hypothetical protein Phou_019790 [Phytohabitans houttuyneae]
MHTMEAQVAMGARGMSRTRAVPSAPAVPGLLELATAAGVVPTRSSTRAARPRLRLTRRGRVVIFAFFLLLAALAVTLAATASRAADPSGPAATTVVQQGDTLWSIADRHHLKGETRVVIEEIRRLNALEGYTVYAGQELKLPG